MEDLKHNQKQIEDQSEARPFLKSDFEEDLKKQNIHTMLEIYGEEYMEKIEHLTR
jgi:hypothetical protein